MNRSPLHWLTSGISQWDPDICHKIFWKTSNNFERSIFASNPISMCHYLTIIRVICCFAEIPTSKLSEIRTSAIKFFERLLIIQRDLVPIYTITNTQRIRIYLGKLKFILVKISSAPRQRKPKYIHVSYCWEFIRPLLFTRVQIRRVFRFVQLWVNAFTRWYKWVEAYLINLKFTHFFSAY